MLPACCSSCFYPFSRTRTAVHGIFGWRGYITLSTNFCNHDAVSFRPIYTLANCGNSTARIECSPGHTIGPRAYTADDNLRVKSCSLSMQDRSRIASTSASRRTGQHRVGTKEDRKMLGLWFVPDVSGGLAVFLNRYRITSIC
jgi:hypothetical protein